VKNIVVFHGQVCTACHEQMQFLTHHGISFTAKDVVFDVAARNELLSLGSKTLPTTIIDGEIIIGFEKQRLSELLDI
jgi:glutaredoxin 3